MCARRTRRFTTVWFERSKKLRQPRASTAELGRARTSLQVQVVGRVGELGVARVEEGLHRPLADRERDDDERQHQLVVPEVALPLQHTEARLPARLPELAEAREGERGAEGAQALAEGVQLGLRKETHTAVSKHEALHT